MKFTVDASVVVKWYVSETHSEEARVLLAHRLERLAPDFVLVELANIFWKKARLREIGDPNTYFQELHRVREAIALRPSADLIARAAQIAAQIDHPVYDCLYIACAEATDSTLITADRRLTEAVANRGLGVRVQYMGEPGVADNIRAAADRLVITQDKVAALVDAYDLYWETAKNVHDSVTEGRVGPPVYGLEDTSRVLNSPAARRLRDLLVELNDEERIDLLALSWRGQGNHGTEWQPVFERFCSTIDGYANDEWLYVLYLGPLWRAGYERLTGNSL